MKVVLGLLFASCLLALTEGKWNTFEEAQELAKATDKLILLSISRESCKPCKKLTADLEASEEFKELSEKFVLAEAGDEISKEGRFELDGKYVPKVLFVTSAGVVLQNVVNADSKSAKAKYFFKKAAHLVKSMKTALEKGELDNGFGKDYAWHDWEGGLKAALEQEKPILAVFHQDWCGACQRLKPKFAAAEEVKELANKFILINTDLEDVVKGDKYKADGEYYPKILFLDYMGEHIKEEWNHGTKHQHVLHYYGEGLEIAESMKRVMANLTLKEQIVDHGFGKHINWVKYEEGLKLAKEQSKPMMVIIHKSYCGACKALKPKIRNDKEFAKLSKDFIMVTCQDDEEPNDDQFDQDGAYIPRVFFLDNLGYVETSLYNTEKDYEKAKFAYGSATAIIEQMKIALESNLGKREMPDPVAKQGHEAGLGEQIQWFDYASGAVEAKKSHKVGMVVMYNDYCEFSRYMKQQFRESGEIANKSKNFVMIKVNEEEGKELGDKFAPDGPYTPRIIFMDPDQNVRFDVNNTGTPYNTTMFYYGKTEDILVGMDLALEKINLTLGRGFGEFIQWVKWEKALELAKEQRMPIMLIIHRQWCSACKGIKTWISNSRPIWKLSYYFIMVNVEDDEEPLDNQFFPDGGYYPRLFFLDHEGKVQTDLHNRDPSYLKFKFSYASEEQLVTTMKFAIAKISPYAEHHRYTELKENKDVRNTTTTTSSTDSKQANTIDTSNLTPGRKILAESGNNFLLIKDALEQAKTSLKPILFIVHRTTCPACKAVLKMISRDGDFRRISEPFILSDIEDDIDDKVADSYDVDGGYVPRIYFLDPQGNIFKDVWNVGTNYLENKFYFYEMQSIYRAMEKVVDKMKTWKPSALENTNEIKEETKGETKEENKGETKEETKGETKDETKTETKDEVKKDEL